MRQGQVTGNRKRDREVGLVLLMVLLLVIMFTGLGLMAMRHTQGELRSAGAYMDSMQASALAEGAVAMAVSDIKENYSYYVYTNPPCDGTYVNYMAQFNAARNYGVPDGGIRLKFSPMFDATCLYDAGTLPDAEMGGGSAVALTPALSNASATVAITHALPREVLPPPGYSIAGDRGFFAFETTAAAEYGPADPGRHARGRATAISRYVVGPLMK